MEIKYLKSIKLPDNPGVYYFKKGNEILYIGRATSLKDRTKSYFASDLISTRGNRIVDMVTLSDSLEFKETDSVLEAVILEANEIKKHFPKYNVKEKDNRSFYFVVITNEPYPRVLIERGRDIEKNTENNPDIKLYKNTFGPYPSSSALIESMKIIRKLFPYRDKCIPNQGKKCFNAQIGLCPGVCIGAISKKDYQKNIKNISLILSGEKNILLKNLEKEMNEYALNKEFEKANEIKRTLFSLTHIQDVSLIQNDDSEDDIQNEDSFRIEAYDVAHLGGDSTAGVMTVIIDGKINKNSYRKFKIKHKKGAHETESLTELLKRRLNHPEWKMPDLVVVDGNEIQKNVAEEIFKDYSIPVVSVVKDKSHKAREILGKFDPKYEKDIILANSEAHRFSIAYHRLLRSKAFFK